MELALKKIGIAIFSISVLVSFGLTSNQAFAGLDLVLNGPLTCADCQAISNCNPADFISIPAFEQCVQNYMDCKAQFCRAIGGAMIQMETTSVLAAGAQYTAAWMIPVIVSGIGIAIVIARKF